VDVNLLQCFTKEDFKFPALAWCMKRKAEILKERGREYGKAVCGISGICQQSDVVQGRRQIHKKKTAPVKGR
jgi:hypothetical protein